MSTSGDPPGPPDGGNPDQSALIGRAQAGDRAALGQLLGTVQAEVYAVCRRMTGNDADGADASQEALISIARGIGRFDGRSRFTTWAYRIAMNTSIDELRRRSRRPEPGLPPEEATIAVPSGESDVLQRLDVAAALTRLSPEHRAAVVLRDLCQLDYAEIAQVLDIPAGTVRSRISRARAALVPILGNSGPADDRPIGAR